MVLAETSTYESIDGQPLVLNVIHHGKCLEYILKRPFVPMYKLASFHFTWMFSILAVLSAVLEKYTSTIFSSLLVLFFLWRIMWEVKKETLLMVPKIGLQVNTVYRWGCERTFYISRHSVKTVYITEAITGQKVLFYLALVVNHPNNQKGRLIPLFQNTMPRLNCLEQIYRGIHEVLRK